MLTIHVVSHTHWDREWYHPAERFRQRLVDLIDELLDEPAQDGSAFLLDGQTVVLEDYLDVRPGRASELASALRDGGLEAGPWFVLADELIPSGEGLVRNLLAGRRSLRALRVGAPPVLYCPDSFGHPAALPIIARGFGLEVVVLWRGFGSSRAPRGNTLWWRAANGDRVLVHHLSRSGYELGANLPTDETEARERWSVIREQLEPRSNVDVALLLNGADHHARQSGRSAAVDMLRRVASPAAARSSTLREFVAALEPLRSKELPTIAGELRDSYGFTWALQGTLASRAPQKRRYARVERTLIRDVEPWTALAAFQSHRSSRDLMHAAWRALLLCQPHDTLCGCSVDQVARAMDHRLESAQAQADGLREHAILALIGHDREAARRRPRAEWQPAVVVRNRAARPRSGVALVELLSTIADIPVGPGSAHVEIAQRVIPRTPRLANASTAQVLSRRIDMDRTEAPRAYPDNDAVARVQAAVWVSDVPGYGIAALPFSTGRSRARKPLDRVRVGDGAMSNGSIALRFDDFGAVRMQQEGRAVLDLVDWESRRDRGDLYTPAVREAKLSPRLLNTKVLHRGPLRGTIEQRWRLKDVTGRVDVRLRFVLDAGSPFLRVHVVGQNAARDHRLRLRFRTGVTDGVTIADAAFGPVVRTPIQVTEEERLVETPVPTAPLHRYVTLFNQDAGATLFSDGLAEYETDGDVIAVTVVRAVGELSRSDIPERPGHAGWPASTPDAQTFGAIDAELALMLHGPRGDAVTALIERTAEDVLIPLTGTTLRSAAALPEMVPGATLEGDGLATSAIKESESDNWLVLRCVNLLESPVHGRWRLPRPVTEAHRARIDETPIEALPVDGQSVSFVAPPRDVITILVR